jgi:ABC-type antimicrobial peptide transport system permease subunit
LKRILIAALVLGLLAVVVFASLRGTRREKGTKIYVEEVSRRDIGRVVKASGEIDPREKVNISAHVVGKIEHLYVEEGDLIRKGQPFLDLEKEAYTAASDQWSAQLRKAGTEVRQAEVALADARNKLARARRLNQEGILSAEQLEAAELAQANAELRLDDARESVRQARANLDKARDDLRKTTIYAPLTGRVIALNTEEGEVVVSGTMNNPASVIGVMEERGQALGRNRDDLAFLPFDAALTLFGRDAGEQVQLQIQADAPEVVEEVKDGIQRVLRQRHHIGRGEQDDFQVVMQDEILSAVNRVLGGVTAVVGGVVSIALLVGGIGIMNIMLVSVTERTREIGVRKALGARKRDILLQFLIESLTLCLVGGLIGIAVGVGGATALSKMAGWNTAISPEAVMIAFFFSAAVGIFFGILPARRAASLDPIESLRYE